LYPAAAQERVFLTEFMAANTKTLADRDRQYSDWIEIYNTGSTNVNLNGWHLTDDREDLKKWRFPAVLLPPNEYLIVFASGKDRRLVGSELHTNFKLDAGGEYLALVRPDGRTVAQEFAPAYPAQIADVSYGLLMSDRATPLVGTNAPKRVWVPTADMGMNWTTAEFNDRDWQVVSNGVGFDPQGNYAPFIGADLRARMLGKGASACVRIPFLAPESGFDRLKLRLRYDDGFVAYLNGWEVARRNAPNPARWNSVATAAHGVPMPASFEETFESATGRYAFSQLDSNTRPKVSSPNTGSTGRFLRLINGRIENQADSIAFPQAAPGLFDHVTAEFDFRSRISSGRGGHRLAFLLIPVAIHGTSGPGVALDTFRNQREGDLPGVLTVVISQDPGTAYASLAVHWNRSRYRVVSLSRAPFEISAFHRVSVRLEHSAEGAFVSVALTANVNTASPSKYTPIERQFIRGLQPFAHRVQFGARIQDWNQVLDLDNVRVQTQPQSGLSVEEFDLSGNLDVLRPGTNLLALHGLNAAVDDPTFLLQPEIILSQGLLQSNACRYFALATPRGVNLEGFSTVAPPPGISVRGGVFATNLQVELRSPVTNGVVRYTLNGTDPTASSDAYARPIPITACVQLKAKTFVPDQLPSPTATETYSLLDESYKDFTSNLPLVILNPFGKYISSNNRIQAGIRVIDRQSGRASLTGPADFDGLATINTRGFSTARLPKNSYTLHFRDANGDKQRVSVLGLPKDADWVLLAPYEDKSLIRDALAYELSNKMGRYAPRTRFVELFLHRYGSKLTRSDYLGVYVFEEKITRGKNRVNVQELTPADNSEPAIAGGYIVKRDHSRRREANFDIGRGTDFFFVYPQPEDITRDQVAWIAKYLGEFERALHGPNFANPDKGYAAYLDVDAFIDQHWLIEVSKNIDGFRYSAFLHKDRGGKIVMGPAWDWNRSWGNADYQNGWRTDDWYTDLMRETEICWFRRLSQDPEFMQRAIDRWGELRRDVFNPSTLAARMDAMAAQLDEAQARNFKRWPILGRRVEPNYYVGQTYQDEINWMKQWIRKRVAWIDSQFPAPPKLSIADDGAVTLRASRGRVLYTLDGTDPRLRGGAANPSAQVYKSPIRLSGDAKLCARVHQGGSTWSAPALGDAKAEE
jgi:hypothetical protein